MRLKCSNCRDEVVAEATNLHSYGPSSPTTEKRRIIESITEKIGGFGRSDT